MTAEKNHATAEQILESEIHQEFNSEEGINFRHKLANQTVKNWAQWAMVAGFIPVPLVDTAAIGGVQMKMIYELCEIYQVEFKKELAISVLSSIAGGGIATLFSGSIGSILARHIPVIGTALYAITQPALSYVTTYAIGTTFIEHFESKGSLIDFDANKAKGFFNDQMDRAKNIFRKKSSVVDEVEPSQQAT